MTAIGMRTDTGAHSSTPPSDVKMIAEDVLRELMENDARIKAFLEAIAHASGIKKVEKLEIPEDARESLAHFARDFDVEKKGRGKNKHAVFSSIAQPGKQYLLYKDKIVFNDNDDTFDMRDAYEMASLAKINPKLSGALHLQGSPEQKYMLLLNCAKLGVEVNENSAAEAMSIPDDVKNALNAQFENLQTVTTLESIQDNFKLFEDAMRRLDKVTTIDGYINEYTTAKKANEDFASEQFDKIKELQAQLKTLDKDQATVLNDALNTVITQYKEAHRYLEAHTKSTAPLMEEARKSRDNVFNKTAHLTHHLRDIDNSMSDIAVLIKDNKIDEARALIKETYDSDTAKAAQIMPKYNDLGDAKTELEAVIKQTPKRYRAELEAIIDNKTLSSIAHKLVDDVVKIRPLHEASIKFRTQWQKVATDFAELEKDLAPQKVGRLQSVLKFISPQKNETPKEVSEINNLRDIPEELKSIHDKTKQANFSYTTEQQRNDDIDRVDQLINRREEIIDENTEVTKGVRDTIMDFRESTKNMSPDNEKYAEELAGVADIRQRSKQAESVIFVYSDPLEEFNLQGLKDQIASKPVKRSAQVKPIAPNSINNAVPT